MQEMEGRTAFSPEFSLSRPAPPPAEPDPSLMERRRRATLARIVETEVIPRLMLAHRRAPSRAAPVRVLAHAADPERLTALLLKGQRDEARALVEARLGGGATPNAIMIEDLGPAARKLGALWETDECDFVEVTLGLQILQELLRGLMPEDLLGGTGSAPSILIVLAPGETHELGAVMVESFFRSGGWAAERADASAFAAALTENWYDALGFSLSCERFIEPLREAITRARSVSRNSRLRILVGGAIFSDNPGLAGDIGADFCAADANATVHLARTLLQPAAL